MDQEPGKVIGGTPPVEQSTSLRDVKDLLVGTLHPQPVDDLGKKANNTRVA
jgi:hypothetical protein